MRRSEKKITVGDRPTVYLKKDTPKELIELLNEQSDLTLFYMHAKELFYREYGIKDVAELLPRKYKFLEDLEGIEVETAAPSIVVPSSPQVSEEIPQVEKLQKEEKEEIPSSSSTVEQPPTEVERPVDEGEDDADDSSDKWSMDLDNDPYA